MDAQEALRSSVELGHGDRATLESLAARMELRSYPEQAVIFSEGGIAGPAYLVTLGHVWLTTERPDGSAYFIGECGPGALLGEMTALTGSPRTSTATAVSEVLAWEIPNDALRDALASDANLSFTMMLSAMELVLAKDTGYAVALGRTTRERVASLLVELMSQSASVGISLVPVNSTELAMMLGLNEDAVRRTISFLQRRGVLELTLEGIEILAPERLQDMAGP